LLRLCLTEIAGGRTSTERYKTEPCNEKMRK
jgi:hypothetical protein